MFCREHVERIVKDCFTTFGGSQLDTPVFERKEVLTDKYGEDAKLIFDLMDQGGEQLSLRYDHTVPLARYLAMTLANTNQSKLWQVGKVYRRDNPVMSKGRMREFSQAVSITHFIISFAQLLQYLAHCSGLRYFWNLGSYDPRCRDYQLIVHDSFASRCWRIHSEGTCLTFQPFTIAHLTDFLFSLITEKFWMVSLKSVAFLRRRFVPFRLLLTS